jgi:hypothetical protein
MIKRWPASLVLVGALGMVAAAAAEKQYAPGVSDTKIKIGKICGRSRFALTRASSQRVRIPSPAPVFSIT